MTIEDGFSFAHHVKEKPTFHIEDVIPNDYLRKTSKEKTMKKKTIIGVSVWAAIFIALMVVAAFFDLEINKALGDKDSIFGQFFRLFGELTGWIILPIAGAILFQATDRKTKAGVVMAIVWLIVTLVGWYLSVNYVLEEFIGTSYDGYESPYALLPLYNVIFALFFTFCTVFGTAKIDKKLMKKLAVFAFAMLIALALSQILANVMKIMWSRQRFRNLPIGNGGESAEGFTPWYHPNFGKNKGTNYFPDSAGMKESDAYKSFPSGHSAGAAMTFILVMLPDMFEKLKKYKVWFYVGPAVYTILVMISRIVNRAHYLSDVTVGATIGAVSCFVAIPIAKKLFRLVGKKIGIACPCQCASCAAQTSSESETDNSETVEAEEK